ncbi:MAG: DNA cytosine methyltransferase [Patescibacteria group bacterium]
MLTHFSLFTGIGGMDLAAEWAGFETVGQVELADYPFRILEERWPDVRRWRDVRDVTGRSVREAGIGLGPTVLSGGFPCQPFSCAGKRRGKDDDRYLWPEMLRVIAELRPAWVVGENVAGIISMALDDVCADLESLGYSCRAFVVPAAGVGAPHMRDRVFVVAHSGSDASRQATTPPCSIREDPESRSDALCSSLRQPPGGANTDLADTTGIRCKGSSERECSGTQEEGGIAEPSPWDGRLQWATEPRVGRVVDGVPFRVDRLRCLGNAVVPQQVYPIFQAIAEVEMMVEER